MLRKTVDLPPSHQIRTRASMRPQRNAAENVDGDSLRFWKEYRFNEAAA